MAERLFTTHPVDAEQVRAVVKEHWSLTLGKVIKASQNHTFEATSEDGATKYAVRATPDPHGTNLPRIQDELFFVNYAVKHGLTGVCRPIAILSDANVFYHSNGSQVVCVYSWADGEALQLLEFKWMHENLVKAQGQWLARLHQVSTVFAIEHADVRARMRNWDELHCQVLKGSHISAEDEKALGVVGTGEGDLAGISHGDLNLSNFFMTGSLSEGNVGLCVFDWDQVQHGIFEYDIAQSCISSLMLSEGGTIPDGKPIPEADPVNFQKWIIAGYRSVRGEASVDLGRFQRMLKLRKSFYAKFCKRAAEEGDVPADMAVFIGYVNQWIEKSGGMAQFD